MYTSWDWIDVETQKDENIGTKIYCESVSWNVTLPFFTKFQKNDSNVISVFSVNRSFVYRKIFIVKQISFSWL